MRVGARGLIALPGSASVALATALAPLHALAGLQRVEVATYQAVSGSGRGAMDELAGETVAMLSGKKATGAGIRPANRLQCDSAGGCLGGGRSIARGAAPVGGDSPPCSACRGLAINATAVRVPVFFGHSLAVHASFERPLSVAEAAAVLQRGTGSEPHRSGFAPRNFRRPPHWQWRPIRYM